MSEYKQKQEKLIVQYYIADCLKIITENTAKFAGGQVVSRRLYEILNGSATNTDDRTAEEIAVDIIQRAGIIME